jgi:hypothetical protein
MSSHHFVKEQQEPALLVLNTDQVYYRNIAGLLEWMPTVVVTQETVFKVMSWGIKVDRILANQDFRLDNKELLEEQYPVGFIDIGEGTYLSAGLAHLIASGHHAANIVQWDQHRAQELETYLNKLDLAFFDGPIRYSPAKNGSIKRWFAKGAIQLHGREGQFIEIQSEGLNEVLPIKHATFIEVEEGLISLKSNHLFWVGCFMEEEAES